MSDAPPVYHLFVGIDIAAATAMVSCLRPGATPERPFQIDQTPAGFTRLIQHLTATGVAPAATLVVLEATSTYWIRLATALHQANYTVSVVNPKQAHDWAKVLLRHAKTDAIDAATLALFAAKLTPPPWTPPPQIYHELEQRLSHRDALLLLRTQVSNQHHALLQEQVIIPSVAASQQAVLDALDTQIAALEREIVVVVALDAEWEASIVRLRTIPGVGLLTAAWVVVATLNFTGCRSAEAAVGYAGLAPYAGDSGTSVRGARTLNPAHGHQRLRTALYQATLSAARYNPMIKAFYDRLRQKGKPSKVARCAAARKLLLLIWAMGTKKQVFNPQHGKPESEAAAA